MFPSRTALIAATLLASAGTAFAQPVELRVTVENLAADNDVAFAPLRVGFHNGTFDAFDNNQPAFLLGEPDIASAPIVSIAEGGSGSTWFPAFQAADPTATLGTVVGMPPGPLLPGASASSVFFVDPSVNSFFTFAAMVVPSNDHFIGNDSPTQYQLFDSEGNLAISSISQFGSSVWNAGSETTNPANAAFLVDGNNDLREDENGVVRFEFAELDAFNGLTTAAGYVFDRQFTGGDEIYRISFEIVPAPGTVGALAMGGLVAARRRRTRG